MLLERTDFYVPGQGNDPSYVQKSGDTMSGELALSTGQYARGIKAVASTDNMAYKPSGFYSGPFSEYSKYIMCGEGQDNFAIGYEFTGDRFHARVWNNQESICDNTWMDSQGKLYSKGVEVSTVNHTHSSVHSYLHSLYIDASVAKVSLNFIDHSSTAITTLWNLIIRMESIYGSSDYYFYYPASGYMTSSGVPVIYCTINISTTPHSFQAIYYSNGAQKATINKPESVEVKDKIVTIS